MKKKLFFVLAVAAIAGCQKAEITEPAATENSGALIVASLPTTKTSVEATSTGLKTSWVKDDAVGIYWYAGTAITDSTKVTDALRNQSAKAQESGDVTTFPIPGYYMVYAWKDYLLYAYYPYNASAGDNPTAVAIEVPASQTQAAADNTEHLNPIDFIYGSSVAQWDYNDASTKKVNVAFHHALSVLNIALSTEDKNVVVSAIRVALDDQAETLAVTEGTVNLTDGSITATAGSPEITLTVNGGAVLSSEAKNFYLSITPGHAGKTFSVYVTLNGEEVLAGQMKVPSTGIPAGVNAQKAFTVSAPKIEYTDLSATATANCYLITKPGHYKFNATVKGNGSIPSELSGVETSSVIAPKSAILLWYNTVQTSNSWVDNSPVIVSSVKYDNGYIYFDTPSDFVPGNVVIAAFAEEGVTADSITVDENKVINNATLLWSWNIWAAEGYSPEATAINADGTLFMDRYVGATLDGLDKTGAYEPAGAVGNYYQWGRKDPVPPYSDYTNIWPTQYGNTLFCTPTYTPIKALQIDGQGSAGTLNGQIFGYKKNESGALLKDNAWNLVTKSEISSTNPATNKEYVDYAVAHPYKLIVGEKLRETYDYTWLNTYNAEYKSLWSQNKTIYDPCPAGWRICTKAEGESFIKTIAGTAVASNNCGGAWNGHYFPINNYRNYNNFHVNDPVQSNYYNSYSVSWTCSFYDFYNWSYFHTVSMKFPSNYALDSVTDKSLELSISNNVNARALNVRCVKE